MVRGSKIRVSRSCGKSTLYVGNLPPILIDSSNNENMTNMSNMDESQIIQYKLQELSLIPIKRIRKRKGYNYGFVEYENHRQAQAALISLRNCKWNQCELRVEIASTDLHTLKVAEDNISNNHQSHTIPTTTTSTTKSPSTTNDSSPNTINKDDTDSDEYGVSPQSSASLNIIHILVMKSLMNVTIQIIIIMNVSIMMIFVLI